MFIRKKVINIFGLALVSLIAQGTFTFAGEEVYVSEKTIDVKTIREKEERGLNLAKKAIKRADPYPGMKTEVGMKNIELDNMIERKSNLATTIQRLKIGLMRKKARYANNPGLREVSVKQYSQNIMEMEDELAEIEKRLPVEKSRLARVTIEVEAEELRRGIEDVKGETKEYEVEYEEAVQERWKIGMRVLNQEY